MSELAAFDPSCEFCLIASAEATASVVAVSNVAIAFLPLKPATAGHTLVIPRRHIPNLLELSLEESGPLINFAIEVGRAIRTALEPEGMNLISSAGRAASQTVFHLHLHLVPRWTDDGFGDIWPPSEPWSQREEREVASRIRRAVNEARGQARP